MLPIAASIATTLTRQQAQSARPNAPVIPLEETRPRVTLLSRVLAVAWHTDRRSQSSSSVTKPRHAW